MEFRKPYNQVSEDSFSDWVSWRKLHATAAVNTQDAVEQQKQQQKYGRNSDLNKIDSTILDVTNTVFVLLYFL